MKVKELIALLQEKDPEVMVVVRGYEDGVDDVIRLDELQLKLNVNEAWYYGSHEEDPDGDTKAVQLVGGDK